jgi:two-component system response regulator RegX3
MTMDTRPFRPVERRRVSMPVTHDRRLSRRPVRVLVIEHDPSYRGMLRDGLQTKGYTVELAADSVDGLRLFVRNPPDIVVMDVWLPGIPATEVCRRLRSVAEVPVIMVTSVETPFDLTRALDAGATDYVSRPHRMRELAARIEAVRRPVTSPPRVERHSSAPAEPRRGFVSYGSLAVDFDSRKVTVEGKVVHLPRREFDLLALLLSPPGRLRARSELIERLWSERHCEGSRTLDTHIRRLRQKLEHGAGPARRLVTVRGLGFRYDVDELDGVHGPAVSGEDFGDFGNGTSRTA